MMGSKFYVIKIIDRTLNVKFDLSLGEKRLLELVNALVSHQMLNPINAILGTNLRLKELLRNLLDLMRIDANHIAPEIEEELDVQEQAGKQLNFYVSDLLSLSQIEKGSFRKSITSFNLKDALKEVENIQKLKIRSRVIAVTHEFIGFEDDFIVSTDKLRLQQALLQIHNNALKFTPMQGSIAITATKTRDADHEFLRVEVRDSGPGISEADQQKLFKMFGFLAEGQVVDPQAVGLGLHIVKKVVEAFDGNVGVQSQLGHGATFWLTFRLEQNQRPAPEIHRELNR